MIDDWNVGGATRQSGGNWAGRFILPEDLAAWYVTNGRYLEQGQMATVGDALLKWDGAAFKIIDATFASTAEADAWVAKAGAPIATNSTATIAGTLVRYGGAGVGWCDPSTPAFPRGDVCVFGNSIIELNGKRHIQGLTDGFQSRGYVALAAILSGGKAGIVENWGIGGQRSSSLLARIGQATRSRAGTVVVMEATNDCGSGDTAESVIPNYKAIADAITASGRICIMCTGIPRASATAAQKQFMAKLNAWIMGYGGGCLYKPCDTGTTLDIGDGVPLNLSLADGIHPTALGASKMAIPLAAIFAAFPARNQTESLLATERNMLLNPLFSGSGTSAPTSWAVQSAPTSWSYVPSTEISASRTTSPKATCTPSPTAGFLLTQNVAVALLPVGSRIKMSLRMNAENLDPSPTANTQKPQAYFQFYNGSAFVGRTDAAYWDAGANYQNIALEGNLELVTCTAVVPAGTTLTQLVIGAGGGGEYTLIEAFMGVEA